MAKGYKTSHKPLDFLDTPDLAHFSDDRDLVGVGFDATLGDDIPHELAPGALKVHFSRFNLMLKSLRLANVSSKSVMRLSLYRDFTTMLST
jgi:hypothetical protein